MSLQLAYIGLSLVMSIVIGIIGWSVIRRTFDDTIKIKNKMLLLVTLLFLWHLYVFLIAQTGMSQDYSLPPKGPLLLIFPAFLFIGVFIYKNRDKIWIQNLPKHWLIFYQTFRILIETIFVFSLAVGILHPYMTIEGFNFDMIFAFSAPLVGYWIYKNTTRAKPVAIWWNYLGLAVIASIIFIAVTTTYFPEFYGSEKPLMPKAFGMYPYVLVPAFLMPSAVFMHILSIVQLRKT